MDTRELVKLPIHVHPLSPSPRFVITHCGGCLIESRINGGYNCSDPTCLEWFHKDCAEVPSEINHSSHPQHPLLLTIFEKDYKCDLCEKEHVGFPSYAGYCCFICDFNIDLICGMKPPSPCVEHPMCHDHPLVFSKTQKKKISCEICEDSIDGPSYTCVECDVYFHLDCIQLRKEVNHPCHSLHPLKFIEYESLMNDAEKCCVLCGEEDIGNMIYHCSICNFTVCLKCTKTPPPLVIDDKKTHKHPLTLLPKKLLTTCNYCGEKDEEMLYMCLQCAFVVNASCIGLPRVININRHDHRISFTPHIGVEDLKCEVCHASINQYTTGGYSRSLCRNYVVHSRCAINTNVWDGVELEGIPEITEDIAPFEEVGDNMIRHVSHDNHILILQTDNSMYDQFTRCEACIHPIRFDPVYSCESCCFILHERCVELPLKKRLVFDSVRFKLIMDTSNNVRKVLDCELCGILSIGFKYTSQKNKDVDIHCGSLYDPLVRKCHPHPLYFYHKDDHYCDACKNDINGYMLRCDACEFDLCLQCSSIPNKIRYSNHEHPIILRWGEEATDQYWCDICENKLDSSKWFYTCYDCGVTIHVECILGDFSRLLPGCIIDYEGYQFEVVANSYNTRPKCGVCLSRCKFPVILKDLEYKNAYLCSRLCFMKIFK